MSEKAAISKQEFLKRQPNFPEVEESDIYYYDEANRIYEIGRATPLGETLPEAVVRKMALCLTGYLQDIASDAGLWRSFADECLRRYGHPVPFYDGGEEYVDYELNRADVRFLTWYSLAMTFEPLRLISPDTPQLIEMADAWFSHFEEIYEDMPVPTKYNLAHGLEFHDPQDAEAIYHLGRWLFLDSYLITPAFSMTLGEIAESLDRKDPDYDIKAQEKLDEAMMSEPTGPLALYTPEWVYLLITGKLPKEKSSADAGAEVHKYYSRFTEATGGKTIKYFGTYEQMNKFFINALGWAKGEEHLSQMKQFSNFVLMVDRTKGMLLAREVAACIADPENPYYNKEYAADHAFELLTVRGLCPGDLLRRIFCENWLPDAHFPGSESCELVARDRDFIARCYLLKYFIGD